MLGGCEDSKRHNKNNVTNIDCALIMCPALSQMLYMDSYLILATALSVLKVPSTAPGLVGTLSLRSLPFLCVLVQVVPLCLPFFVL